VYGIDDGGRWRLVERTRHCTAASPLPVPVPLASAAKGRERSALELNLAQSVGRPGSGGPWNTFARTAFAVVSFGRCTAVEGRPP